MQQIPVWIEVADERVRPWACLVTDVEGQALLATNVSVEDPDDEWLCDHVWQAITSPAVGEPHRPGVIQVADDKNREILAARLEPIGVKCVVTSDMGHARQLIGDLADQLGAARQPKGLLSSPGVTPSQVAALYEAAASFYKARPWRNVPGDTVIRIECGRFDRPWYAIVMGQLGIEQGVSLYDDADFVRGMISGSFSHEEMAMRSSSLALMFESEFDVPPDDLDAAKEHGWPVAGPEAYPGIMRVTPGMKLRAPLKAELELLEGALRALPEFLARRGEKADIAVTISAEPVTFQLTRME